MHFLPPSVRVQQFGPRSMQVSLFIHERRDNEPWWKEQPDDPAVSTGLDETYGQ